MITPVKNPERIKEFISIAKETVKYQVVDIGGAVKPFPFASHIVDIQEPVLNIPYTYLDFGGSLEYRLPFDDKSVDFVWCQQTLEDLGNPFQLMREMQRIGKAGFIEIPSREWESTIGVEADYYTGFCHHRWYGELFPVGYDYEFVLTHKSPFVTKIGYFYGEPDKRFLGFMWQGSFWFRENLLLTKDEITNDIMDFAVRRQAHAIGVY